MGLHGTDKKLAKVGFPPPPRVLHYRSSQPPEQTGNMATSMWMLTLAIPCLMDIILGMATLIGDLGNRTDLPVISGMMGVTFFLGFYGAVIGGIICAMSAKSPMCKLQLVLYVATIFIDILLIMNITIS